MVRQGKLLVIEGLDGSGKATQASLLADYLGSSRGRALKISFPDYKSESSALVRLYLSGELGAAGDVNAYAASCFYAADRYISFHKGWKKEYMDGYTIIADRYATSNAAHQMSKLPREEWNGYLNWLADFEYVRMGLPRPDRVLYLDMPPEASRLLLQKRYGRQGMEGDIHERDTAYLHRCREAALYAAERGGWQVIPCCDGDRIRPVEDIFAQLKPLLP